MYCLHRYCPVLFLLDQRKKSNKRASLENRVGSRNFVETISFQKNWCIGQFPLHMAQKQNIIHTNHNTTILASPRALRYNSVQNITVTVVILSLSARP